jgi:flagellar basal-body rod protein FlgB
MFSNTGFGNTIDLLHRTMDVSVMRRQVISNNIANAETPHFKRTDVNFEAELKRAFESQEQRIVPEAQMTDPRHIPFNRPRDWRDVAPQRRLDYLTTSKNNGNNVDIEQETMQLTQNQMRYEILANALNSQFSRVNLVLR